MKKILGLAIGIMLTALTYAQSGVTFKDAGTNFNKAATTVFHFSFDNSYAEEDLKSHATYYTDYFTAEITAEEGGHQVTFTLVEDTDMARRVISRYFVSLNVPEIMADGTSHPVDVFFQTYIMKD